MPPTKLISRVLSCSALNCSVLFGYDLCSLAIYQPSKGIYCFELLLYLLNYVVLFVAICPLVADRNILLYIVFCFTYMFFSEYSFAFTGFIKDVICTVFYLFDLLLSFPFLIQGFTPFMKPINMLYYIVLSNSVITSATLVLLFHAILIWYSMLINSE